jgi:hypothetical protein
MEWENNRDVIPQATGIKTLVGFRTNLGSIFRFAEIGNKVSVEIGYDN